MKYSIPIAWAINTAVATTSNADTGFEKDPFLRKYHSEVYTSEPSLRSECPNWEDVFKNDKFNVGAFSATSKNGRPCFVNRRKHALDVSDPDGSISYGKNYAIYRAAKKNQYELDLAVTFHIGELSENREEKYEKFNKKIHSCVKNNPILLTDGERFLKLNLLTRKSLAKSKFENFDISDVPSNDSSFYGITLWDERRVASSGDYGLKASCTTMVHELLHITGLHDEYRPKKKYASNVLKNQISLEKNSASIIA